MALIRSIIWSSIFILASLVLACGDSDKNASGPGPDDPVDPPLPAITPGMIDSADFADTESALMTLWYCDKLLPDGNTYIMFRDALRDLRRIYWHDYPEVKIKFVFPSVPSQIVVYLTDSAIAEIRSGSYHAWDSLNTLFRIKNIDSLPLHEEMNHIRLSFEGQLHPNHLALYYKNLAGVTDAQAIKYDGDWPNLYPWILNNKVTFLARDAWGDCPSGCLESHFFYFKQGDSDMTYIGDWQYWTPVPDWWPEGRTAFCAYTFSSFCN